MIDAKLTETVSKATAAHQERIVHFLRELISIPSPGCGEEAAVRRVAQEMESVGFDRVRYDVLGNVVGSIGNGPFEILYDAHLDTVGLGDIAAWSFDPFLGSQDDDFVYGLGASNNKGAIAAMVYAAEIYKSLGPIDGVTLHVVGSVMEGESEGLAYRSLLHSELVNPAVVVLGKCTDLTLCRGQRGRLECKVTVRGGEIHASEPTESGVNVTHEAARIIVGLAALNERLPDDELLGQGALTVTRLESEPTSALYLAPRECSFYFDRRLTAGETLDVAIEQVRAIAQDVAPDVDVEIEVLRYDRPSYTGQLLEVERHYPQWQLPADHAYLEAAGVAAHAALGEPAPLSRWSLSTNGVYTMGVAGIPTFGFGPGREQDTRGVDDRVAIDHLAASARFYALFPHAAASQRR